MVTTTKAYKGIAMEGVIATWYAKNTGRDQRRFRMTADAVAARIGPGSRLLEVAPGPGFLAIDLARRGYVVTAIDISRSFVEIVRENAARAGVSIDVRQGNASALPFTDGVFDFVVCTAAFKNFSDPIGALNEMYRVLKPGGEASIFDLRKEASQDEIADEVRGMGLSPFDAWLTRAIFRFGLLQRAYTRAELEAMASASRFCRGEITAEGIGFELRLTKSR